MRRRRATKTISCAAIKDKEGMMALKELPQHWWFDRCKNSRQSPWLISTLSELEEKTKKMLNLIEEDADSFARRAEMYYKKRPLLMNMIEDFYRTHRSLAEQYDQLKSGSGTRRKLLGSLLDRSLPMKVSNATTDVSSVFSSDSYNSEEESEVDDPEQEQEADSKFRDKLNKESEYELIMLMKLELARVKEKNAALKSEIAEKDEEKREVIRQLASSINFLKEENANLRECMKDSKRRCNAFEFKKLTKEIFSGKIFTGHCKSQIAAVAL
ncbi:protein NETWORKED 3C-like isoform X1 [Typha latifolia]|uniref:protein NETWORKED 3C-like isoform X1 n=1 Tax=Typha latifolia TaxID=4733 RepID=UPI003C2F316E